MKSILVCLIMFCASCSVFTGFKHRTFTYTTDGTPHTISLRIPAAYNHSERGQDSAGNNKLLYYYKSGAVMYFGKVQNQNQYQWIDTTNNKPSLHPAGGLLYKGFDSAGLYWKEYRLDSLRFGYKNLHSGMEVRFDSAVNYAGYRKEKH